MTTTKTTFALNVYDARYLAEVALAAASKDDITPIINAGCFDVEKDHVSVTATDRYRVHQAAAKLSRPAKPHRVVLSREALTWIVKNAAAFRGSFLDSPTLTISATEGSDGPSVTITISAEDGRSLTLNTFGVKGNYPPVSKLIDNARAVDEAPGHAQLRLDFVGKTAALAHSKYESGRVKFTVSENPNKPGPVLIEYADPETREVYATALVQPNLELK